MTSTPERYFMGKHSTSKNGWVRDHLVSLLIALATAASAPWWWPTAKSMTFNIWRALTQPRMVPGLLLWVGALLLFLLLLGWLSRHLSRIKRGKMKVNDIVWQWEIRPGYKGVYSITPFCVCGMELLFQPGRHAYKFLANESSSTHCPSCGKTLDFEQTEWDLRSAVARFIEKQLRSEGTLKDLKT